MRTFHGILDLNNDGVISYDDFKLLADKFVQLGHLNDKDKRRFSPSHQGEDRRGCACSLGESVGRDHVV
ncbi:hypothetical protein FQR65_LT11880 [Abscondita terminalis]|nr:hypothetical protein FQR65_LT11880 [Abscondita terminalis]